MVSTSAGKLEINVGTYKGNLDIFETKVENLDNENWVNRVTGRPGTVKVSRSLEKIEPLVRSLGNLTVFYSKTGKPVSCYDVNAMKRNGHGSPNEKKAERLEPTKILHRAQTLRKHGKFLFCFLVETERC